mmetsp:Transcript_16896/g.46550  ORF Transcript_16896/g.46550 Transcript_16896/m.46550 type:complete len:202 (+) Transcript_16896:431-1036(+)
MLKLSKSRRARNPLSWSSFSSISWVYQTGTFWRESVFPDCHKPCGDLMWVPNAQLPVQSRSCGMNAGTEESTASGKDLLVLSAIMLAIVAPSSSSATKAGDAGSAVCDDERVSGVVLPVMVEACSSSSDSKMVLPYNGTFTGSVRFCLKILMFAAAASRRTFLVVTRKGKGNTSIFRQRPGSKRKRLRGNASPHRIHCKAG